eukprot:1158646-Pelagomonas_calceolata.AAC.8
MCGTSRSKVFICDTSDIDWATQMLKARFAWVYQIPTRPEDAKLKCTGSRALICNELQSKTGIVLKLVALLPYRGLTLIWMFLRTKANPSQEVEKMRGESLQCAADRWNEERSVWGTAQPDAKPQSLNRHAT